MARRVINVAFEVDTIDGSVAITRRRKVPAKSQAAASRTAIDRYPLGFLVPTGMKLQEYENTLHAILLSQLGWAGKKSGE